MIVALSSLNGSDRLRDMLAALTHVRLPAGTTIHALGNDSEDGTPSLLKDFRSKLSLAL